MARSPILFYAVVITPAAVLMALEIVSSRILAPHFGSSVYVWGSIIGIFLAAMSLGYLWGGRLADRHPSLAALGRLILAAALAQTVVLLAGDRVAAAVGEATGGSSAGTLLATGVLFGPVTVGLAMVSPYAVKLATRDLGLLGGTAGHLFALSTAGSLAGTLGATFVLIPYLELGAILRLLLFLTVAASAAALATAPRAERAYLALAASLLLLTAVPRGPRGDPGFEVLADRITPYQTLRVTESGGVRYLHSDGTVHAAVNVASRNPELTYPRHAGAALLLKPDLASLLVLGMGGGSAGSYLQQRLPELRVDYVDIDPAIPELARAHLFFEEDHRTAVHIDDARRFLADHPRKRWDFIYADTYIGSAIPFHLATVEFFQLVRTHLRTGGVFGVNMIADPQNPFFRGILRSLSDVFRKTYIFAVPGGNYLFLATDTEPSLDRRALLATARRLDPGLGLEPTLARMASLLREEDFDLSRATLLTDRFAPVNHLIRLSGNGHPPPAEAAEPPAGETP